MTNLFLKDKPIKHFVVFLLLFSVANTSVSTQAEELVDTCHHVFSIARSSITALDLTRRFEHPPLELELENHLRRHLIAARQRNDFEDIEFIATILIGLNQRLLHLKTQTIKIRGLSRIDKLDAVNKKLFAKFAKFNPQGKVRFSTWAGVVGRNELIDLFRRQKSESDEILASDLETLDEGVTLETLAEIHDHPIEDLIAAEDKARSDQTLDVMRDLIGRVLNTPLEYGLTERHAHVLRLRFPLDGSSPLSLREIANHHITDLSYQGILNHERRALEVVRMVLEQEIRNDPAFD